MQDLKELYKNLHSQSVVNFLSVFVCLTYNIPISYYVSPPVRLTYHILKCLIMFETHFLALKKYLLHAMNAE